MSWKTTKCNLITVELESYYGEFMLICDIIRLEKNNDL